MAKVSVDIGLTLKLPGPDSFNMIKPSISYTDIDTDGDVAAQIEACNAAAELVIDAASIKAAQTVADLSGAAFETQSWTRWRDGSLKKWQDSVVGEVTRQSDEIVKLGGAARPKKAKGE